MALTKLEPYMVDTTETFTFANTTVGNITATNITGNIGTSVTTATTITANAQPNITSVGTLTSLTVSGAMTYGLSIDNLGIKTGATGTVEHDVSQGGTFYHTSPAANFTANFTNITLSDNKATVVAIIIIQGATPYVPVGMQIAGQSQTVKWNLGASAPTGTASKTDIISYTIIKISGVWTVFGQYTYYG